MNARIRSMWPRLPACAVAGFVALACGGATAAADTLLVPTDYMTIQEAIHAAATGDEVVVETGTYLETLNTLGKAITVRSADPTDPLVVAATIVDGSGLETSVITCNSAEGLDTVFDGLTIRGGTGTIPRGSDHPLGGGMYLDATSPTVMHCVFVHNVAGCGGGLYSSRGAPRILSTRFDENRALRDGPNPGFGGGVYAEDGEIQLLDCTFRRNIAQIGGGLRIGSGDCGAGDCPKPLVAGCMFLRNTALIRGGGIDCSTATAASEPPNLRIVGSTFQSNLADFGAGLNHHTGFAEVLNCRFELNTAETIGGGIHVNFEALLNVTGSQFIRNCSHDFALGAGGAVGSSCGDLYLSNSTFTGNFAFYGGAVWGCASTDIFVGNCTFYENSAFVSGGAVRSEGDGTFNTVVNSILWSNIPDQVSGAVIVEFSDVQDWPGGAGNMSIAPEFRSGDDLRLRSGSQCIDTASVDWVLPDATDVDEDGDTHERIPLDLAGNPRFVDDPECGAPRPLRPPVDMGAYEFCRGDVDFDGVVDVSDIVGVIVGWDTADPDADTNADGVVDEADLASVLVNWGSCG